MSENDELNGLRTVLLVFGCAAIVGGGEAIHRGVGFFTLGGLALALFCVTFAKDGRTIEQNVADGVAVYLELLKLGIPAFSPHLSGLAPSAWAALTHAEWIAYDCAILDRCTHLLMMPRWETSTGARLEFDYWMNHHDETTVAESVAELCEMVGVAR